MTLVKASAATLLAGGRCSRTITGPALQLASFPPSPSSSPSRSASYSSIFSPVSSISSTTPCISASNFQRVCTTRVPLWNSSRWKSLTATEPDPKRGEDANSHLRGNGSMTEVSPDYLDCKYFFDALVRNDVSFFCGVPDSLLKDFCKYIDVNVSNTNHVIAANEGNAVAMAAGYHLATNKFPLVYLQNSGLGNAVNPLVSLADRSVYSVPMLLLVGWRGEPGRKDEPQHRTQGAVTSALLDSIRIPYAVLPDYSTGADEALAKAMDHMVHNTSPYCLLVRKRTFSIYTPPPSENSVHQSSRNLMSREDALQIVTPLLAKNDVIVCSTGMLSRELYEYRVQTNTLGGSCDFLTVGSMGHSSSIALTLAMQKPQSQIFCFDGDGAALMHLGSLAVIGSQKCDNFKHVVFNNGAHDSVGGQATVAGDPKNFSFTQLAKAVGYTRTYFAETSEEVEVQTRNLISNPGPAMLEIRVGTGHRSDLGRPSHTPRQSKVNFMINI